jgi:itaconate CoA-transferase
MFGIQNEREWAAFCERILAQPALAKDPRYDSNIKRNAARSELVALIGGVFATLTAEQAVAKLDATGIANARINTPAEVWEHPQLKARERWREVDSPVGAIPALLPPANLPGVEPRMDPIPEIGEHTARILAELGYAHDEIALLRNGGAI